MEKYNIYKLSSGKSQGGWQLPMSNVLVEKIKDGKSLGLRKIVFVPGESSIYLEDVNGDMKREQIWFDDGNCIVPKVDTLKNEILQKHPWFNKHYYLFDKQEESRKELAELRIKDRVRSIISESDSDKLLAVAFGVFNRKAFNWDVDTAELELRKYADKNPTALQKALDDIAYQSKYFAALAFKKGIVELNAGKTSVVWSDNKGEIIRLAKGEDGINKFGDFLYKESEETRIVLQEVSDRLEKIETKMDKKSAEQIRIEQLEAELKRVKGESSKNSEFDLEKAQEAYKAKFEVDEVPARYRNDLEWINKKLAE